MSFSLHQGFVTDKYILTGDGRALYEYNGKFVVTPIQNLWHNPFVLNMVGVDSLMVGDIVTTLNEYATQEKVDSQLSDVDFSVVLDTYDLRLASMTTRGGVVVHPLNIGDGNVYRVEVAR